MKLSPEKIKRISEQILAFLYSSSPQPVFTYHIALELARDEEFIKKILKDLSLKGLVVGVKKSPKGTPYLKRIRWKLSDTAYIAYKKQQY